MHRDDVTTNTSADRSSDLAWLRRVIPNWDEGPGLYALHQTVTQYGLSLGRKQGDLEQGLQPRASPRKGLS